MAHLRIAAAALAVGALLPAQQTRVDYPDSALTQPQLLFPFYTPGGGGAVRYQTLCPATFAGLPAQPMLVTGVGVQIAGQERYDRFEVRCGATTQPALTSCWTANLPDQRLQRDLSGTVLPGGVAAGQPVNQWVEFDLDQPFAWTPGEGLVLDVTAAATTPGRWCLTGTGSHDRVYSAPWTGAACGGIVPGDGIKFRVVFEPVGFVHYGQGCAGSGGFVPAISGLGAATLGNTTVVQLTNALGGAPASLLLGLSRATSSAGALPLALGGGCSVLTSADATVGVVPTGSGPGQGFAAAALTVPADPAFAGFVVHAQWAQLDPASPAVVPATFSAALAVVVL